MKRLYITILACLFLFPLWISLHARGNTFQVVRVLIYRLERLDSCMVVDMNIDLGDVSLAPDCTVCLYPCLRNGADSLVLAPVMLNGPQSDLMYRRRKALGTAGKIEKIAPYVVLREGDHPLPRINYYRADIPYRPWMDRAKVILRYESHNADSRLIPLRMETEAVPPAVIVKMDTVVIHDTLRIASPHELKKIRYEN